MTAGDSSQSKKQLTFMDKVIRVLHQKWTYLISSVILLFFNVGLKIFSYFKPVTIVFFGESRLGEAYQLDWLLTEFKTTQVNKYPLVVLTRYIQSKNVCNPTWIEMWKRQANIVPFNSLINFAISHTSRNRIWPEFISEWNLPLSPTVEIWESALNSGDFTQLLPFYERAKKVTKNDQPNIEFDQKERARGEQALADFGLKPYEYICFHSRDSAYLEQTFPHRNWSYHDYRDSSIENYLEAIHYYTDQGFKAVRMGNIAKPALDQSELDRGIIDFPFNPKIKNDFNDIFIGAHCKFFVLSDTGMSIVPEMFRRPCAFVNWTPILRISPWVINGVFIFKKFYDRKNGVFLPFSKVMRFTYDKACMQDFADNYDIVENSSEEIKDAVLELESRMNGTWEETDENLARQKKYWALYGAHKYMAPKVFIGSKFLMENEHLIQ